MRLPSFLQDWYMWFLIQNLRQAWFVETKHTSLIIRKWKKNLIRLKSAATRTSLLKVENITLLLQLKKRIRKIGFLIVKNLVPEMFLGTISICKIVNKMNSELEFTLLIGSSSVALGRQAKVTLEVIQVKSLKTSVFLGLSANIRKWSHGCWIS